MFILIVTNIHQENIEGQELDLINLHSHKVQNPFIVVINLAINLARGSSCSTFKDCYINQMD
jgi:hypothetical protein